MRLRTTTPTAQRGQRYRFQFQGSSGVDLKQRRNESSTMAAAASFRVEAMFSTTGLAPGGGGGGGGWGRGVEARGRGRRPLRGATPRAPVPPLPDACCFSSATPTPPRSKHEHPPTHTHTPFARRSQQLVAATRERLAVRANHIVIHRLLQPLPQPLLRVAIRAQPQQVGAAVQRLVLEAARVVVGCACVRGAATWASGRGAAPRPLLPAAPNRAPPPPAQPAGERLELHGLGPARRRGASLQGYCHSRAQAEAPASGPLASWWVLGATRPGGREGGLALERWSAAIVAPPRPRCCCCRLCAAGDASEGCRPPLASLMSCTLHAQQQQEVQQPRPRCRALAPDHPPLSRWRARIGGGRQRARTAPLELAPSHGDRGAGRPGARPAQRRLPRRGRGAGGRWTAQGARSVQARDLRAPRRAQASHAPAPPTPHRLRRPLPATPGLASSTGSPLHAPTPFSR